MAFGDRLVVGLQVLALPTGVRVPVSEPIYSRFQFDKFYQYRLQPNFGVATGFTVCKFYKCSKNFPNIPAIKPEIKP